MIDDIRLVIWDLGNIKYNAYSYSLKPKTILEFLGLNFCYI